jgi:hypothetical protein
VDLSENSLLLLFAYGVFQPGELAFLRVKEHVAEVVAAEVSGRLLVRDGLPLLELSAEGRVTTRVSSGSFGPRVLPNCRARARQAIRVADRQRVRWERTAGGEYPRGRRRLEGLGVESDRWQGRDDPLFKIGGA